MNTFNLQIKGDFSQYQMIQMDTKFEPIFPLPLSIRHNNQMELVDIYWDFSELRFIIDRGNLRTVIKLAEDLNVEISTSSGISWNDYIGNTKHNFNHITIDIDNFSIARSVKV